MSGSRGATASHSRKVKERLVKVLFGKEYSRQGREAHQKLDYASHSYEELRQAYIQRVQLLHPDKYQASGSFNNEQEQEKTSSDNAVEGHWGNIESSTWQNTQEILRRTNQRDRHEAFVDLKEAWDAYEKIAKAMKTGIGREIQSNFTMFGVGCSFSDSPDEQQRRAEIMDQACRGWFSAGQLPTTTENSAQSLSKGETPAWSSNSNPDHARKPVDNLDRHLSKHIIDGSSSPTKGMVRRRSLIDHLIVKKE